MESYEQSNIQQNNVKVILKVLQDFLTERPDYVTLCTKNIWENNIHSKIQKEWRQWVILYLYLSKDYLSNEEILNEINVFIDAYTNETFRKRFVMQDDIITATTIIKKVIEELNKSLTVIQKSTSDIHKNLSS